MEEPLTVSELMGDGDEAGERLQAFGRVEERSFVARLRGGQLRPYALGDKRLYQLCELMCMRIEDDACQRAKQLAR